MALTDFFSSTEVNDGLSSPDRVEGLINVIRFENDKEVKNIEETSRQWSTVAKTIACTGNKECLESFVQLGGLCFVNTWLNNVLKNASDISDGVMEESLLTMLQALGKLPVNSEKLTSAGVAITLKSLTVSSSSVIKERVHTLLDSWNLQMNTSEVDVDVKEDVPVNDCKNAGIKSNERNSETSRLDVNNEVESISTVPHTGNPDFLPVEKVNDVPDEECSTEVDTADSLDHEAVKDGKPVAPHSTEMCTVKENMSITEPMSADVDTGVINTRNGSYSNSKSDVLLNQNVGVLADDGSGESEVKPNSVEHSDSREDNDKQHPTSCFPENEGGCFRSNDDDAKADKNEIKSAQKDPVMAAPEGREVDTSETVCSASQEKMQDGLAEQVSKSSPQTASLGKELSSDNITAKDEDDLDGTEPSRANVVVQEAEMETKAVLGFDLNEEVFSEDLELNCDFVDHPVINQTSVATSVISASRPAASSAGRLQFNGNLGWKGSAATSAFRPASLRKPLDSDNITSSTGPSSNSLDQRQNVHDFDLNMADDQNADNTPDSVIAVSSSHPSEESCVEIGPSKSKRAELDLNSLGDAPPSAYWSANGNGLPFGQQNAYRSPSPTSSSSSVHPSMWDLDLNKKFSMPNPPYDQPPNPGNSTIKFVDGHWVKRLAASQISIMGARVDVGRDEPFFQSQLHPNGNISGFRNFLPPSINPSQPLQSFMYRPGIPITMFDPRGSSILPHMMGPSQPPYLMNTMAAPPPSQALTGIAPPSYSSIDPNMLYMNDAPNRTEHHTRQYLMSTQGGFLEPHSTPFCQPSSFLTKRKEPHSGWDPYHHGFSHLESPRKS